MSVSAEYSQDFDVCMEATASLYNEMVVYLHTEPHKTLANLQKQTNRTWLVIFLQDNKLLPLAGRRTQC